jgi:hypothetical protein
MSDDGEIEIKHKKNHLLCFKDVLCAAINTANKNKWIILASAVHSTVKNHTKSNRTSWLLMEQRVLHQHQQVAL